MAAKPNAAESALARGDLEAAANQLAAFANQVRDLTFTAKPGRGVNRMKERNGSPLTPKKGVTSCA
jgi:hypothetical protein